MKAKPLLVLLVCLCKVFQRTLSLCRPVRSVFLKSECKSTDYFSNHQIFSGKSLKFNSILTIKGRFWCFLWGNTLFYTRMRGWGCVSPADLADLRGFFGFSRRLFFILSQISQITQIFYTVLIYLTRSFLGWEDMGLGAGRYGIVVRKLVGEKCTEL